MAVFGSKLHRQDFWENIRCDATTFRKSKHKEEQRNIRGSTAYQERAYSTMDRW